MFKNKLLKNNTTVVKAIGLFKYGLFNESRIIVIIIGLLTVSCTTTANKYLNGSQFIGDLRWEITEATTKQVVDKGATSVQVRDIQISKESPLNKNQEDNYFKKGVSLNKNFYFTIHELPETKRYEKEGFGLTVLSHEPNSFCWEWFNLNGAGLATKLQGIGELEVKMHQIDINRKEITQIKFLTDVTFRINIAASSKPEDNPKWLVTIFKESWVQWPSLIGNTITPNR